MRVVALVDLDDTLFQTRQKCPPDVHADDLTPLGFTRDGAPLSFATPRQMEFVTWLIQTTYFVPVTARGLEALRRVHLPFTEAVCAHGGMILGPEDVVDPVWASHVSEQAASSAPVLAMLEQAVRANADATDTPVSLRILAEGDVGLYVLVKHPGGDVVALNRVVDGVTGRLPPGWTDHRNGNNIALMPPFLGKQHAVAHLMPSLRMRFAGATIIGIGDSITDAPFMALCDFAMTPKDSQLAKSWCQITAP